MVCTYCSQPTRVVNSRHQKKSNQVWRRRQCVSCQATFSTEEAIQHELAWIVQAKGAVQPFSRDKLFLSLYSACEHRKTALKDAQGLTATVMSKLPRYSAAGTLNAEDIARVTQVTLNRFDQAASTRYQSLHR